MRGIELIQGIDGHELDPGRVVNLLFADPVQHLLHNSFRPAVSVMVRILEQLAMLSQQCVVNTPCVDSDPRQFYFLQPRERFPYFEPEPGHVPVK